MTSKRARVTADSTAATTARKESLRAFGQVIEARVGPDASFAEIEAAGLQLRDELLVQLRQEGLARRSKG